jgi:hypothetical protein
MSGTKERSRTSISEGMAPIFVSIGDAALLTGESIWTVKQRLREGTYRARKAGRRTLIEYASVKAHAADLPAAQFAPARRQSRPDSLEPMKVEPAAGPGPQRRRRRSRPAGNAGTSAT